MKGDWRPHIAQEVPVHTAAPAWGRDAFHQSMASHILLFLFVANR